MDANGWIDVKEMTDAEQRVRAYWEHVERRWIGCPAQLWAITLPVIWCSVLATGYFLDEEAAWQAANEFTEERQRERAKLAREMDLLHPIIYDLRGEIACNGADRKDREETLTKWLSILARLLAALAELERGMKKEAK
jgi:hypothetical protein